MGTIGAIIGSLIGSKGGIIGALLGAVIGNYIGDLISQKKNEPQESSEQELFILGSIAALLAKLAKADGRVSEAEIEFCENAFRRLGITGKKREYCIDVFRNAKNDTHSIYAYASSFADSGVNTQIRQLVYDILWDLAAADGSISPIELDVLKNLPSYLKIGFTAFYWQCSKHGIDTGYTSSENNPTSSSLYDPYEVLEISRSASNDEIKKAYRNKAKKLHPDILKAQGLSDTLIAKANDQMARINAAWDEIKKERNIH